MLIYYAKYMKGSIKMSQIITHNLYENQETWAGKHNISDYWDEWGD